MSLLFCVLVQITGQKYTIETLLSILQDKELAQQALEFMKYVTEQLGKEKGLNGTPKNIPPSALR